VINSETIPRLRCRIVAGGANNQLREPADAERLRQRSILYAPDYVVTSAAPYAITGRGEFGYTDERLAEAAAGVGHSLQLIFRRAEAENLTPAEVADRIAEERIAAAAQSRALSTGR
jgi:leucine dehydrogenase